ncbi:MAG: hypothetical protein HS111_06825 [Kofleriaceae bacterium]|nr:hypothetical protein [Kofleriaceae bacterium]MCL4225577.1 hypothetical protein [Myxococcales bacterium]
MSTTTLPFRSTFAGTARDARRVLASAYDTLRAHVRRIGDTAGRTLDRIGTAAESYVGARVKARVKPPIVVALVTAAAALVVGLVAAFRK